MFVPGLFAGLAATGVIPGVHYSLFVEHSADTFGIPLGWVIITGLIFLTGGVAYASRVPERIRPGSFDIYVRIFRCFLFIVHNMFSVISFKYLPLI